MAAPARHEVIIEPPHPNDYTDEKEFQRQYDMWKRSGGYEAATVNLKGLKASVDELNTLVGVDTSTTVQAQLDDKVNTSALGTIASQDADSVAITGGALTGINISDSDITVVAGTSTTNAQIGGTINVNTTAIANGGAIETDLMSFILGANSLSNNNDYYEIEAWGIYAANANNKTIKVVYGSDVLFTTGVLAANAGTWSFKILIVKTGAALEEVLTKVMSNNALLLDVASSVGATQNTILDVTFKLTGQGAVNDDITQKGMIVRWYKAA